MVYIEEERIEETLPYGANSEDITKLIEAIKIKQGNDKGIQQVYGKPNIENSRKVLKAIGISSDGLNFSNEGKKYAYETNNHKKEIILLKLLLQYPAYEYFLLNISNEELSETSLEEIKNYWEKNDYGTSEYNRNDASSTFARLIELAGLGSFKLGRKGKLSRIEWRENAKSLIRDIHSKLSIKDTKIEENVNKLDDKETPSQFSIIQLKNEIENTKEEENNTYTYGNNQETELVREVLGKSLSNCHEQKNLNLPEIKVSVDVNMTDWDIDKIVSFFKATKETFKNSDE